MRFRKDSLVFKVVLYNNLAIIISTVIIAFFLSYMNDSIKKAEIRENSERRIIAVQNSYDKILKGIRDELLTETNNFNLITVTREKTQEEYMGIIRAYRERLIRRDNIRFYEVTTALLDEKGELLAESGLISDREELSLLKSPKLLKIISENVDNLKDYYLENINGRIYFRAIIPYYISFNKYHLIVSMPFNYETLQKIKGLVAIGAKDRMFLIAGEKYYAGDFYYGTSESLIPDNVYNNFLYDRDGIHQYDKKIGNIPYHIVIYPLKGLEDENIGLAGIAFSQEQFFKERKIQSIIVAFLVIVFLFTAITVFTRIFGRMFKPLLDITRAAEAIRRGNYNYNLEFSTNEFGEIRKLNNSFRKMLHEIKNSNGMLNDQNTVLRDNISRIEAIERLLLGLHYEEEVEDVIKTLLKAFTSESGLGYGRAMYFRYSREADHLLGELSTYNKKLEKQFFNGIGRGFEFQIRDLENLVKYIKIPYKGNNLIAKALMERKVVFFNQKGYIHNLGNDLFKSLGINNFLIIPIYSKKRNIGCILVDYFDFDKVITTEEYELINLLAMNVSLRVRSKHLEEEKLDRERNYTITRLLSRFLSNREIFLNNIENIISRYKMGQRDFYEEFESILPIIEKLKKENIIFREYSNTLKNDFEEVEIDRIFNEIVEEQREESLKEGIILSVFNNSSVTVFGDRNALKKAFFEIMKNSYVSLVKSDKVDKKLNVIVTKDKNISKTTIRIIDTGIGMTEQQLNRIYEPFASLNGDTPGLGLSLVYKIIKAHSGVIKYYSKLGEGTEVKITLNTYKGDENL